MRCKISQFIDIDANKKTDMGRFLYKLSYAEIARSTEITNECIKKMHLFILKYPFYLI